ncbi:uncharacterized protein LOC116289904 [Actinia tenebrosa]|uniref:Uncharacterized protein LOC116289904 n=1 Tax=Actinia tenebrosa TaxID=6105 RepID=A0A6P8HJ51_ACTTE|nr:uncharacterized protein LOC116289904 [Actinia tenebrosa]
MGHFSVRLSHFFAIALVCLISEVSTQGQKKGFRGGDKSYGIKVEATAVGTNLQYKLPEAKAKSSSPTDWEVDNDNAEMLFAMNSPILANVITKNPKFSVKGQWPAYKTTLTLPKGVKTGSKKNEMVVKLDTYQGSGFESSGEALDEEEVSGSSQNIKDKKVSDSSESGSGIYEGSGNKDLDETIDISGSGYAENEEAVSHEEQVNQVPKKESEQPEQERRSDVAQKKNNESEDDFKDLSFEKVRLAVESLGHFSLRDERTSKALKDIITHAKKVVREAKMVLNDVASVVTSVKDFVNGNYDLEDKDNETQNTVLEAKNDSGVKKAREEAERAALQASYAAKRAQAASEMARKFANKIWNSAKTSRSFGKSSNAILPKQMDNESLKKQGKQSFNDKNKQNEKEMSDILQNFEKVLGNKFFKIERLQKKNVTQEQRRYGNHSATKTERNYGNQTLANVSREHSTLRFVVDKQRGNHSNYDSSSGNKKTITKEEKEGNIVQNVRLRMKSDDKQKDRGKTRLFKGEKSKLGKESYKIEEENRKRADKNHANNREALKAAKVEKLFRNSSNKKPHNVAHGTKVFSQVGRKNMPKLVLPWKHRLPGDTNEVVKNAEARLGTNGVSVATAVKTRKKDGSQREGDKLQIKKKLEESGGVDDDTSTDDDVDSSSDQSGSTISGSYDIELELEPEKLEFVKGEGKMNEKRIRIKDLTANGQREKVPPATLKEILKAIKRVEGILGFTIEKKKTNEKKSRIYH